jgi:hypothetical protein
MKGRLVYDPELSPRSKLSSPKGDGSVFKRLYEEAAKRRLSPPSIALPSRPIRHSRTLTEQLSHVNGLLVKHSRSRDQLELQRIKQEEEQLKEVKNSPGINKESKALADKALERNLEAHAQEELLASRHLKSKSMSVNFEVVKDPTPVSSEHFRAARLASDLIHTFTTRSPSMVSTPSCRVNISTRRSSNLELPKNEAALEMYDKVADIRSIRQLLAKTFNFDPVEPPDPLDMDFMDRGRYWIDKKHQKLSEKVSVVKDRELEGCTFQPKISRMKSFSPSRHNTSSTISSPKYSEIHSLKSLSFKQGSMKKNLLESTIKSETSRHRPSKSGGSETIKEVLKPLYTTLSPVQLKCSYPSKLSFELLKSKLVSKAVQRPVSLRLK